MQDAPALAQLSVNLVGRELVLVCNTHLWLKINGSALNIT